MFDFLKTLFNTEPEPEPKVGDILVDRTWGDYNKIGIVKVSENKKEVMYKFLIIKGNDAPYGGTYTGNWRVLSQVVYKLVN
jgi:hypothetical protein